jgi:hypothetical protein
MLSRAIVQMYSSVWYLTNLLVLTLPDCDALALAMQLRDGNI